MRRALQVLAATLLSLPSLGSALIALCVPPVARLVPAPVESLLRPLALREFALLGKLPPGSLAGRAFYGSYDALVPLFGAGALAAHALLLGALWVALVVAVLALVEHDMRKRGRPKGG
jgi:hypothetical protein